VTSFDPTMLKPTPPFDDGLTRWVRQLSADHAATFILLDPRGVWPAVVVRGAGWHEVPRWAGDALEKIGLHDLPGHSHGQPFFARRFMVLTQAQFTELGEST
jgi:hypothetical protein